MGPIPDRRLLLQEASFTATRFCRFLMANSPLFRGERLTSLLKQSVVASPGIPIIMCPKCSAPMRLVTIEPGEQDHRDTLSFECRCGFEYKQPMAAADE
jgi:hypothetical protein